MIVNIDKRNKDPKCKISTVKKEEKEPSCKLEYDIDGSEVVYLRCCVYKKWEKRIQNIKGFNVNSSITLNKQNNVKNVGKSYVTEQAAGIFTDYFGKNFKGTLASDLAKAHYYCFIRVL